MVAPTDTELAAVGHLITDDYMRALLTRTRRQQGGDPNLVAFDVLWTLLEIGREETPDGTLITSNIVRLALDYL